MTFLSSSRPSQNIGRNFQGKLEKRIRAFAGGKNSKYFFVLFFIWYYKLLTHMVDTEEEEEQQVGYGTTEEGVRRRRWEKWDHGSTGATKCGLFYSWKVAEAEKRIDRSTRARRKLLHIHLPVFTSWLPAYLPEHLPARSLVLAACLACPPSSAAAIRTRILFVDHLSPFNKVSGRLTSLIDMRDTFARVSIRDTGFSFSSHSFIMLPRSSRSPVDFPTSARVQGVSGWNASNDVSVSFVERNASL